MFKKISFLLEKEHIRWFPWIPVGLAFGIGLYFLFSVNIFFSFVIFISLSLIVFIKKEKNTFDFFLWAGILIAFGVLITHFRVQSIPISMIKTSQKNQIIEGVLENIEDHPRKKQICRWTLSHVRLTAPYSLCQKVQLGDFIRIHADLLPFSAPITQDSFDWRRHYFFKKIKATGRVKELISIEHRSPSFLSHLRHSLGQTIKKNLKMPYAAIAKALLIGDTSGISPEIRQNFADAGIAHILAISGLHMSILTGLIFLITRRFLALFPYIALRYPIKLFSFFSAMIASFFYMLISGIGFPVIRSFCMGIFLMIGFIKGRHPFSIRSVALAASIILLFYPEALLSISFQLSFAAVIVLICCHTSLSIQNKFLHYFMSMILTTILATVATFPFTITAFGKITLQAVTGNFFSIPLTTFWIMPSLLLSLFFPVFFPVLEKGLSLLVNIASFVSHLPGSNITVMQPSWCFLPMISFFGLWFLLWKEKWRYFGLFMIPVSFYLSYINISVPDIMVGHSTLAYYDHGTLYVSHFNRGKFEYETWMRTWNVQKVKKWSTYPAVWKGYTLQPRYFNKKNIPKLILLRKENERNYFIYGNTIKHVDYFNRKWE